MTMDGAQLWGSAALRRSWLPEPLYSVLGGFIELCKRLISPAVLVDTVVQKILGDDGWYTALGECCSTLATSTYDPNALTNGNDGDVHCYR